MGLRLNKGREFYVGITAVLLFPSDLLQALLLLSLNYENSELSSDLFLISEVNRA